MTLLVDNLDFIIILAQIVMIDLLLGGDNAVVIALACRKLPPHLQKKAIFLGTLGAVLARIILLVVAVKLLALPWLKVVGGVLLLWVGLKLVDNHDDESTDMASDSRLWKTVMTIVTADVVMSLDNVLAVAAAGRDNVLLVALGVIISIPIIVLGSRLVLALLQRFPLIITFGGALIGWIAGTMLVSDPVVIRNMPHVPYLSLIAGAVGAGVVLLVGMRNSAIARKEY